MSPRPQAIIFDMDGVIADTEFVDLRIQTDFVRSARRELGEEPVEVDPAQLMGRSYEALWGRLGELVGAGWSLDETRRRFSAFDAAARRTLDYGALFRPGVNDVLDLATERGLLTAVCSSSSHAHITEVLSACGVLERFDVISSGEDVAASKPNPEVYLRCVASLSDACGRPIDAARCRALHRNRRLRARHRRGPSRRGRVRDCLRGNARERGPVGRARHRSRHGRCPTHRPGSSRLTDR